jgi:DNA-binding transcriptional LysR family regulator
MFDDILSLQLFEKVATLRSFSKAAELMNFSQVMVSKRIAKLEAETGFKLFDRSGRTVSLTSDGQRFFKSCVAILSLIDREKHALTSENQINGTLRLAAPPFFVRYHVIPYLDTFFSRYPDLKLEMVITENHIDLIKEGIDFEIRIGHVENSDYEQKILFKNPKVICASPAYLKAFGMPTRPEDLHHHNCLIFAENKFWNLKKDGQVFNLQLSGNVTCDNGEVIKEMVLAGLGITLKSRLDIQNELKNGDLIHLFSDYDIDHTYVYAQYPPCILNQHHITVFLDFLKEVFFDIHKSF